MARGGYREGSGRKAGGVNTRHAEIAAKAAAEGTTPLEVMLDNMRFYHQQADAALAKLLTGAAPAEIAADVGQGKIEGDESPVTVIDALKIILGLRKAAGEAAKDAAPYMHPRFGQIDDGAGDRGEDAAPLSERLQAYQRRDDIDASAGKVVALKPGGK